LSDPPQLRLTGQTALVTGSTRGIGRTIAEWLAREGANIVVSGRELEAVERPVAAMRALGVESWGIPADLARVSEAHRLAEATLSLVPRLDILVNNAGMSIRGHLWEVSDSEWEEQVNVWLDHAATFRTASSAVNRRITPSPSLVPVYSRRVPSPVC
jgi:NAD(P)-dependent dehydrogenase (short-subunit alcohol dehydrogenase family)